MKIPVLEVFGPTVQGEGMVAGQKTMFVRTGGCDYSCAWCDSAFTWDGSQKADALTPETIVAKLQEIGGDRFNHVTISGGNPALHKGIGELVQLLKAQDIGTAVETQGSFWQEWLREIDDVTISPKPPSSKMITDWEKLDYFCEQLQTRPSGSQSLKVVIFNEGDLAYAKKVHARYPNMAFYLQVGNDDLEEGAPTRLRDHLLERYEWLVDTVMEDKELNNVRVLPQIHTLIWGNKQGV
ncbi:7-carboxy-7-deazaguanine synthase QueE [Geomicrobium sp. JCM 19055]|uniref:7-carboxy-7-deazaguanine synthase QueE n=1 Tax=Geomicrobium sp. JCM 19055 TaxID=1460649 RepID=UPI00045EDAD4|nr:7-carboxy-7-deazaguanine synthase QueE [Geomicrobium sp. JCM 19055]GAJ98492.1 queuosine biosynthesis QueE radical SAM protein [Geomicrobium sp. JCM 19055]